MEFFPNNAMVRPRFEPVSFQSTLPPQSRIFWSGNWWIKPGLNIHGNRSLNTRWIKLRALYVIFFLHLRCRPSDANDNFFNLIIRPKNFPVEKLLDESNSKSTTFRKPNRIDHSNFHPNSLLQQCRTFVFQFFRKFKNVSFGKFCVWISNLVKTITFFRKFSTIKMLVPR